MFDEELTNNEETSDVFTSLLKRFKKNRSQLLAERAALYRALQMSSTREEGVETNGARNFDSLIAAQALQKCGGTTSKVNHESRGGTSELCATGIKGNPEASSNGREVLDEVHILMFNFKCQEFQFERSQDNALTDMILTKPRAKLCPVECNFKSCKKSLYE